MIANVQHWTELIAKRLSGNIRDDEARMLDAWIARDPEHKEYYDHLVSVWSLTQKGQVQTTDVDADWTIFEKRLQQNPATLTIPKIRVLQIKPSRVALRVIASVAAVLLIGVVLVSVLLREPKANLIAASAGDRTRFEVVLPDGSKVILRRGGSVEYNEDFKERDIVLHGEAYFEVTHDEAHPFTVSAGNGSVRVLGTKFNVKERDDKTVELYVTEGRVAFAPASRKFDAKIFSEGQAGMLAPQAEAEVERTAAPGPNATSWISGRLVFDHTSLDHVLEDIARHFAVQVQVADSALFSCELKADFENATLATVFETLRFSLNLDIDTTGNSYLITGNPCNPNQNN